MHRKPIPKNEGNEDIVFETKSRNTIVNKELIGNYRSNPTNNAVEREIRRRSKQITSTSLGRNLEISITAISELTMIDTNYYSRFIIMLFLLIIILIVHLVAGFYIPDKSMRTEFGICLTLYIVIYLTHFILELGFLNNIHEKELDYYSNIIEEMLTSDYDYSIEFCNTVSDIITLQDSFATGEEYDWDILNGIMNQVVSKNESLLSVAILEGSKPVYVYPDDFDISQYSTKIKEAGNVQTQKTLYNKANNTAVVFTKIHSNVHQNAVLFTEIQISDSSAFESNEKFDIYGFRDAYGDTKLLNLRTDEAMESFVEKIQFDETNLTMSGIKNVDGTLYGYVIVHNPSGNINVFRYELENLYNFLVVLFLIVMILILLLAYFAMKVFNGYTSKRKENSEDSVYEKLIEKIDQDIADSNDDLYE
mgnify:CR=1 FL=1